MVIILIIIAVLVFALIAFIFRSEDYRAKYNKESRMLNSAYEDNVQREKKYDAWSRYAIFLNTNLLPSIDGRWDTIRQYEQERDRGITHTQSYHREMSILKATIEQEILDSFDLTGDFGERLKNQKQRLRDALGYNVFRD